MIFTHLAFVSFLKPLPKPDQAALLHWSQLAQISLNVVISTHQVTHDARWKGTKALILAA